MSPRRTEGFYFYHVCSMIMGFDILIYLLILGRYLSVTVLNIMLELLLFFFHMNSGRIFTLFLQYLTKKLDYFFVNHVYQFIAFAILYNSEILTRIIMGFRKRAAGQSFCERLSSNILEERCRIWRRQDSWANNSFSTFIGLEGRAEWNHF